MTDAPPGTDAGAGESAAATAAADPDGERTDPGDAQAGRYGGRRVILTLYAIVVAIAGVTGFAIGYIGPRDLRPVSFLGVVTFQPTPVGLAMYGMATLGVGMGAVLALVVFVSRRYPDA